MSYRVMSDKNWVRSNEWWFFKNQSAPKSHEIPSSFCEGLVSHFNILLESWRQKSTTPKYIIFPFSKHMFSKKQSCICGLATLLVLVVSIEKEYGVTRYMWCPSYIKWIL